MAFESVVDCEANAELPGLKRANCFITQIESDDFCREFSSHFKLVRFVPYSLRFIKASKYKGCTLTVPEINEAERRVMKIIQRSSFRDEINRLSNGQEVKGSKLSSLAPLIDDEGLLRVATRSNGPHGGRLKNANIRVKVWGCVFICMSTKAVHLEIVSDCTSEAFLAAFRRFMGRRAIPRHVYSDNGPNFVGANRELRELYALMNSDEFRAQVHDYALRHEITWHFNPPFSPHFGGIWEAAMKSCKHHFKRVVGDQLFTFEELYTFAVEVEALLNSRPLCPMSTDPNDPVALTLAHILVGQPLTMLPENDFLPVPANRLSSWQIITKARQHFWKRWQLEYLTELQKTSKMAQLGA